MNALLALWLPILLSAVVVFVISSLVHMVFKWHAPDYKGFANEDAVRDAIRAGNPAPGQYVVPYCGDMKEMAGEAMMKKYRDGPVGFVALSAPGPMNLGRFLGQWIVLTLLVATAAGYLAGRIFGLDPGSAGGAAKLVGAVTFLAYGVGTVSDSIWMGRPWPVTARHLCDSALYAIGTWGMFLWLWPK
jgi:hypothetical protein